MPLYEYECESCAKRFERIQKFSDPPIAECPSCGAKVKKLPSSPAIQFKGTGWYITDYARKTSSDGSKSGGKDSGSESGKESGKDSGKESGKDSGKESGKDAKDSGSKKSDSSSDAKPAAAAASTTTKSDAS